MALGLIGFPALALAWHWWRIHRNPVPFHDTNPLSFALSVALPLALYLTWWYAPAFSVTSDAVLLFAGGSMVLAALRGYALWCQCGSGTKVPTSQNEVSS